RFRCGRMVGEGVRRGPQAVVDPGSGVDRADSLVAEQVANGALQADRTRPHRRDGGIAPFGAADGSNGERARCRIAQRCMNHPDVAPQAEQFGVRGGEEGRQLRLLVAVEHLAGPWPVMRNDRAAKSVVAAHPSISATAWNQATSGGGSQTPATATSSRWENRGR